MRKIAILLLLTIGITFQSCDEYRPEKVLQKLSKELGTKKGYKKVSVGKRFSLSVPVYMKQADHLNEDATLQYQNVFKETYFVLIEEPKDQFIQVFDSLNEYDHSLTVAENYRDVQLQMINENIRLNIKSIPELVDVNGLNACVSEVSGSFDDISISYLFGFIEGPTNVYMFMTWTGSDRWKKYKPTFEHIINSFEILEDGSEE